MKFVAKTKLFFSVSFGCLLGFSSNCFAINLIQAYEQALKSDPIFKAAEAQWLASRQAVPIARSFLLPNIAGAASLQRQKITQSGDDSSGGDLSQFFSQAGLPVNIPTLNPQDSYYDTQTQYSISLSQTVFNWSAFMALREARASVKQAEANYYAAKQNLMIRLSTAYFNVLQAYDVLKTTQAQKRALANQLKQTEEQFRVGLIAITGVEQTKASYDSTVAQEIANKNTLSDQLEALRAITGVYYYRFAGLNESLPLVKPQPANVDAWVRAASQNNYTLLAAVFGAKAAMENVRQQQGGHYPVLNATADYSGQHDTDNGAGRSQSQNVAEAGFTLNLPVYSGGLITAQTRQASYLYAQAAANAELNYRNTIAQTRQFYLGVLSGISQVKADKQAVKSNQSSLKATRASYLVGTNTIVDVLTQQSNLYTAVLALAQDQYAYLINTLNLKLAAGRLSEKDLGIINSWLKKRVNISRSDIDVGDLSITKPPISYGDFVSRAKGPVPPLEGQPAPTELSKGYDSIAFEQNYHKNETPAAVSETYVPGIGNIPANTPNGNNGEPSTINGDTQTSTSTQSTTTTTTTTIPTVTPTTTPPAVLPEPALNQPTSQTTTYTK